MPAGLRHRFSTETNNLPHFNRGSTTAQRFKDYERLLDANNYEELSNYDINRLNSEQYGSTNFEEYYTHHEETSFIEQTGSDINTLSEATETTRLVNNSGPSITRGGGSTGLSGSLSLPVGNTGLAVTGLSIGTGLGIGVKKNY
ncbi:hypothetical protein CDAR_303441 [Caerostris darwini]|uniref:Uncharacterized protein n=1 Tax=Caerostris darwini TaxID=1538125 RepID=A0AAV4MZF4_9ARAC|nr:hypothetical protein CDAR_303441 [Caerostris darwini]